MTVYYEPDNLFKDQSPPSQNGDVNQFEVYAAKCAKGRETTYSPRKTVYQP